MEQWAEQPAGAAQMPFLALLQGAMEADGGGDGRKRPAAFASCPCPPVADIDLLESCVTQAAAPPVAAPATRAERRRKRPRPRPRAAPPPEKRKKPEEAESQRMTHIAVERNRRRLMNDHLASLRSLIPSSYIPRGDQATVVGGAIDYVKQLEQQLVALQAAVAEQRGVGMVATAATAASDGVFVSPQYTRLVRAVAAMEDLRLTVLHLAVTSVGHDAVVYCFNLKVNNFTTLSDFVESNSTFIQCSFSSFKLHAILP
uniref:BHLH domain-containing protein n=1 Tax=Oryza brachyantha TaxID=4533 RepID=J3LJE5_ORYBR